MNQIETTDLIRERLEKQITCPIARVVMDLIVKNEGLENEKQKQGESLDEFVERISQMISEVVPDEWPDE